jgi:hypothetical protein
LGLCAGLSLFALRKVKDFQIPLSRKVLAFYCVLTVFGCIVIIYNSIDIIALAGLRRRYFNIIVDELTIWYIGIGFLTTIIGYVLLLSNSLLSLIKR